MAVGFFKLIGLVPAEFHTPEGPAVFHSCAMEECVLIFPVLHLRRHLECWGQTRAVLCHRVQGAEGSGRGLTEM